MASTNRVSDVLDKVDNAASRDDVITATKKIRGYVDTEIKSILSYAKKYTNGHVKAVNDKMEEVLEQNRKVLEQNDKLAEQLGQMKGVLEARDQYISTLEKSVSTLRDEIKDSIGSALKSQEKYLNKRLEALAGDKSGDVMEIANKAFSMGRETTLDMVKSLFSALPATQVIVPEKAIHINQAAPQAVINIPQQAPPAIHNFLKDIQVVISEKAFALHVDQPAPQVQVNLPEITNKVDVPEIKIPEIKIPDIKIPEHINKVHVQVPPRQLVRKDFKYMDDGRPLSVIESPIDEVPSENKTESDE